MSPIAGARFIQDVTIPDDTEIPGGSPFTKTWLLENNGDEPWGAGYVLYHVNGVPMMKHTSVPLPACEPGRQVSISLQMTAPLQPGSYFSDWRCRDARGRMFGDIIWVRIKATTPTGEGVGTNDCQYIDDVTIPDDAITAPGTVFVKTWRVRNSGTLPWGPGYTLNFEQGTQMSAARSLPLPACEPGREVDVSVEMTAPERPGKHFTDWSMRDPQGRRFGVLLWLRIVVPGAEGEISGKPKPGTAALSLIAPHFSQRDSRWRKDVLGGVGSPVTIGSWGCLLTCFAMVAQSFGVDTDPARLNRTMLDRGGFFQNYLVSWNALQTVFGTILFDGKDNQSPVMLDRIDASLAARCPVPLQVDRTPVTRYNDNDQHWVLALARDGDDYIINDPIDLDPEPTSLMARYGRGGRLHDSILSAIFYRRTV